MVSDLRAAAAVRPELLVMVRLIGTNPLAAVASPPPAAYVEALDALALAVAAVGGQAQWIWGMATSPRASNSYSLLGRGGQPPAALGTGAGADLGTAMTNPPSSTRLRGLLVRDKQQRYAPRGSGNGPFGTALAELALAEPTPWPLAGSPVLSCIGTQPGVQLGADLRAAY